MSREDTFSTDGDSMGGFGSKKTQFFPPKFSLGRDRNN